MPAPASGALSPDEAARQVLITGLHHLSEGWHLALIKNMMGAMLLGAGSLLAQIIGGGFPKLTDESPGLQRMLQGAIFPIGLIVVYAMGAELFTGYPMWYALTILARKGSVPLYIRSFVLVWVGNLIGALAFAWLLCYMTDIMHEEPWRDALTDMIREDIIDHEWHVIFLRAVGCGWLVTIAMFLGSQNQDFVSKALGLWLPFFISTSARMMHTVEYMFLAGLALMLGSDLGWARYFWKCLLPVTLGNTVGGGLITGGYMWVVHLKGAEAKKAIREDEGNDHGEDIERYLDNQ